jgi:hypothetical protein
MDLGLAAELRIVPLFSIQAEAVFTWDNAPLWQYTLNDNQKDVDRYTQKLTGLTLQFPLMAKLNFYPGKFRLSPFFGGYFIVPLGEMKMDSPRDEKKSYSYSVSLPLGLLGGLSASYPMGPGLIFADLRYVADLGEPELQGGSEIETYRRHMITVSFGYEFGLIKKQQNAGSSK